MIADNWDHGRQKTLIFVYYAGHGVISKGMLHTVCNPPVEFEPNRKPDPENKLIYNIEKSLKGLGEMDGAFVVAIFDCCRENYEDLTRGGMEEEKIPETDMNMEGQGLVNWVLWYGCAANSGVTVNSTIA